MKSKKMSSGMGSTMPKMPMGDDKPIKPHAGLMPAKMKGKGKIHKGKKK
jgi:hypothetical protein